MNRTICHSVFAAAATCIMLMAAPAIQAQVVINEIHYNPSGRQSSEFVELYNAGAGSVNVAGWSITDAFVLNISAAGTTIPSHGYLVVAKDPAVLQTATGYAGALQWTCSGQPAVSDGGEIITLHDGALGDRRRRHLRRRRRRGPRLPTERARRSSCSTRRSTTAVAGSWRASTGSNGTPGAQNSIFSNAATIQSESPARRTAVATLPSVSVTFSASVTGVTAGSPDRRRLAATSLSCPSCSAAPARAPTSSAATRRRRPGSVAIALAAARSSRARCPSAAIRGRSRRGSSSSSTSSTTTRSTPIADAEFLELYNAGRPAPSTCRAGSSPRASRERSRPARSSPPAATSCSPRSRR